MKRQDVDRDTIQPFARWWPVCVDVAGALARFLGAACATIGVSYGRWSIHLCRLEHKASRAVEECKMELH
eukprot:7377356-Prymnesium_polylepis.1